MTHCSIQVSSTHVYTHIYIYICKDNEKTMPWLTERGLRASLFKSSLTKRCRWCCEIIPLSCFVCTNQHKVHKQQQQCHAICLQLRCDDMAACFTCVHTNQQSVCTTSGISLLGNLQNIVAKHSLFVIIPR